MNFPAKRMQDSTTMPPAQLPLIPGLKQGLSKAEARAREDVLTAELIEYCRWFRLPAVLPDTIEAGDAWGANCGPMSLAAVLGLPTVEAARPLVQPFRGFMSPTDMTTALAMAIAKHCPGSQMRGARITSGDPNPWPQLGLVRIQWLGPWCAPGVNPRAAYRFTHWVGVCVNRGSPYERIPTNAELKEFPSPTELALGVWIYDATPNRWIPLERWSRWCETLWPKRATGWAPVTRIDVSLTTCPNGQVQS